MFDELEQKIARHVSAFARELQFDLGGKKLALDSLWINVMNRARCMRPHIHPHSVISGTYYVSVPPRSGAIRFEDPRLAMMMAAPPQEAKARPENRLFVDVQPRTGMLLLWESWLRHGVEANGAREPRISVSFNYAGHGLSQLLFGAMRAAITNSEGASCSIFTGSIELQMLCWSLVLGLVQLVVATTLCDQGRDLPYRRLARAICRRRRSGPPARMLRAFGNFRETSYISPCRCWWSTVLSKSKLELRAGSEIYFRGRLVLCANLCSRHSWPTCATLIWAVSVDRAW